MQYKPYGKMGYPVSILGFGAMRLPGIEGKDSNVEQGARLLVKGIEQGINYIDTAHVYGEGSSERAVGEAIQGFDRSKLYIATKIPVHDEESAKAEVWRKKLELSLSRLKTSYIDFILFHGLGWNDYSTLLTRPGSALDEAKKAQQEGLIRHICFSSHDDVENVIRLIDTGEFYSLLLQYNYLDQHNEPAIQRAAEHGMGVTIMGPVAGGRLAVPEGVVADQDGVLEMKTPEVALRFVWSNPNVNVALSGMSSDQQLEENVVSASKLGGLDDHEQDRVQELMQKNLKLADLYCTGCGYCMPCPNDVQIPENFRYMNWYRVWGMEAEAKKAYAKLNGEKVWTSWVGPINGLKADACLQCGECLSKCPQNIDIIHQLEDVAESLGK
jgi:predicted aldo/keto reductase-like oxidoreductase